MKRRMMWGVQILTDKKERMVDDYTLTPSKAQAERNAALMQESAQPKVVRVMVCQ